MLLTRASAVGLLALCVLVLTVKAQNLTAYNVEANNIAAVGISAGASMAIQLHVAYSASVKGAGIIAGAPYWCAMGQLAEAITSCMSIPEGIDLELLWAGTTYAYNVQGAIDDPRFLRNARVWLFSGESDTVVDRGVVKKTKMYYEKYVRSDSQITFVTNISAEHAWITDNYGNGCDNLGEPFINNCNFDASGAMLRHIYPQTALKPRAAFSTSNLLAFSQANYTGGSPSSVSMGDTGFIYVPTSCKKGASCKLIVAFHGCEMDVDSIKNAYYAHSGLNQWAETNNMIVLYPQATTSTFPYNPKACWDWWGYTNSAYATQQGQQLSAVKAMINALTGKQ